MYKRIINSNLTKTSKILENKGFYKQNEKTIFNQQTVYNHNLMEKINKSRLKLNHSIESLKNITKPSQLNKQNSMKKQKFENSKVYIGRKNYYYSSPYTIGKPKRINRPRTGVALSPRRVKSKELPDQDYSTQPTVKIGGLYCSQKPEFNVQGEK